AFPAPPRPTVFALRPSQECISRGRRPDLAEGGGGLASDRPERVLLQGGLEAFDCLGVSGELAEIPARIDSRPHPVDVPELPRQFVPPPLRRHLFQARVI